jgi:CTP:molybdopterin cytidylyltransferase MocA
MGVPKALLRLPPRGTPLAADQIARLREAGCRRIAWVVGADAERIEAELGAALPADPAALVGCRNQDWRRGPFSSLQTGLAALGLCPGGVLVLPVDVAGVEPRTMACLAAEGWDAAVPTYEDRAGHPVWLSAETADLVRREPSEARLDHLLSRLRVRRVPVADPRVRSNLNGPEDWERFLREAGARPTAPPR